MTAPDVRGCDEKSSTCYFAKRVDRAAYVDSVNGSFEQFVFYEK